MSVSPNMELRKLELSYTSKLSNILDRNGSWKSLMEKIPRDLDDIRNEANSINFTRKYSAEEIQQIDESSKQLRRSPTQILLDEWGTSGRNRATVSDLLDLLVKVELYRAADFVATDILNTTPPKRPVTGPSAWIDISLPTDAIDEKAVEELLNNAPYPNSSQLIENLDSIINNNNRDFNNSVSVDHVKEIHNFFQSSDEYTSDLSEAESKSDLIVFSVKTMTNDDHNSDGTISDDQKSSETPKPVFSRQLSNQLSIDNHSTTIDTQWNDDLPNLPNLGAIDESSLSKQYNQSIDSNFNESQSIESQVISTLIPDISDLHVRDETSDHSFASSTISNRDENVSMKMSTESYIPNLPLLNGNSS